MNAKDQNIVRRRRELRYWARYLRQHARTFALSLNLLPWRMRFCATLAYLLARLSDEISDTFVGLARERVLCLEKFAQALGVELEQEALAEKFIAKVSGDAREEFLVNLQNLKKTSREVGQSENSGGVKIFALAEHLFAAVDLLGEDEGRITRQVLGEILRGQIWDIRFFELEGACQVEDWKVLDAYTYAVAGSVGEFWTRLIFYRVPHLLKVEAKSEDDLQELLNWGRDYGCALQLVNILRDHGEDLQRGRNYLPPFAKTEQAAEKKNTQMRDDERTYKIATYKIATYKIATYKIATYKIALARCEKLLAAGQHYARSFKSCRLRLASELPAAIATRMLPLLSYEKVMRDWHERGSKIKLSRSQMRIALMTTFLRSFF